MYTPLYIKTDNSLLRSMIKIDDLIKYANKNNIKNLTITDNNMYGVMDFYHACLDNNIKPIIGLETMYNDKKVIIYAKNYDGYLELVKISSNGFILHQSDNLIIILPYDSIDLYDELSKYYMVFKGFKNKEEKQRLDGDIIYLNETLCLDKKDTPYLKYLYGIKNNKVLLSVEEDFSSNYLKLEDEIDIINNDKFTSLCNVEIKFNNDVLPKYPVDDAYDYLKKLCIEGLKKNFGAQVSKVYQDRLKYELDIIKKMGFCDYFLVVWDYVKYAKESGILVGPGRGSAAGSLVSYLLNITTVDPIKYNLLFERFLNPERVSMPDIDVDFEATRRDEVVSYVRSKYGEKNVAPIITFGTMASRQVIRDVARVMDVDLKDVDMVCKKIDARSSLKDNLPRVEKELYTEELKQMYKVAMKFENIKRHSSIHAAGIVMSKTPLDDIIPLDKSHDFYTTAYDMTYLEKIGLLKMDFLAIRNLTLIDNILKDINLSFDDIPLNDSKAIKLFHDVYTLGIFQFESSGMMNFLRKLKVNNFTDIYNALALYRPGPMASIDTYIKRREGRETIDYLTPALEPVLKETYGILIYQEQIMQTARIVAGYSLGEADILRRAMSKKKEDVLLKERDRFIERSIQNGYTSELANKIYNLIFKFASYGFNKSHSVVYAMISYKMAYLKANYPNVFLKHLLTSVIGDEVKTKNYIYECLSYGVKVSSPHINYSDIDYKVHDDKIIYPFTNIKGVGRMIAKDIIEARNSREFTDIYDFFARCHISKKVVENLILVGALDSFGYNRKTLIENLDVLLNYGDVASYMESEYALKPEIVLYDEYPKKKLMLDEYELLGLYLTKHPVTDYRVKEKTVSISELPKYFDKYITFIGMIDRINVTKSLKPTCFITVSDEVSSIDLVLFNKVYMEYRLLNKGDIIKISGKVEKRFDKYQIIVNSIKVLE